MQLRAKVGLKKTISAKLVSEDKLPRVKQIFHSQSDTEIKKPSADLAVLQQPYRPVTIIRPRLKVNTLRDEAKRTTIDQIDAEKKLTLPTIEKKTSQAFEPSTEVPQKKSLVDQKNRFLPTIENYGYFFSNDTGDNGIRDQLEKINADKFEKVLF